MDQIISNFRLSEVLLLLSLLLHATMRSVTLTLSVLLGSFSTCLPLNTWLHMSCGDEHKLMEIHIQSVATTTGSNATTRMMDTYRMNLICSNGTAGRKRPPLFVVAPSKCRIYKTPFYHL